MEHIELVPRVTRTRVWKGADGEINHVKLPTFLDEMNTSKVKETRVVNESTLRTLYLLGKYDIEEAVKLAQVGGYLQGADED